MQSGTVINFYQNMFWNNKMEIQQQFGVVAMRNWGPILLNPNQQGLHMYKTNMPPIIAVKSVAYPNDMFEVKTFSSCRSTYTTCFLMPYSTTQSQKQTVRPILPDKNLQTSHKYLVFWKYFLFQHHGRLNRYIQSQKNPTNHVVTPVARLVVDIVWVARGFTHPCPAYVEAPATRKFLFTKWFPLFQLPNCGLDPTIYIQHKSCCKGYIVFFLSAVQTKIKSIKGPDNPTCQFFAIQ